MVEAPVAICPSPKNNYSNLIAPFYTHQRTPAITEACCQRLMDLGWLMTHLTDPSPFMFLLERYLLLRFYIPAPTPINQFYSKAMHQKQGAYL